MCYLPVFSSNIDSFTVASHSCITRQFVCHYSCAGRMWNSLVRSTLYPDSHITLSYTWQSPCTAWTYWGQVTHICVSKLTLIGSNNGLVPGQRQATIWTNVGILLIGPLGTNFNEIIIEIHTFSLQKIYFKMSSGKWQPFCFSHKVLTHCGLMTPYGDRHLGQHWLR